MITGRWIIFPLLLGILSAAPSCGKKNPPSLPQEPFPLSVRDLGGEWVNGHILLKGNIRGPVKAKKDMALIEGCRVYYGIYPLENPPCPDCPIEYQGHQDFGPEIVSEEGFFLRMPVEKRERIYFLKVHLIGPESAVGPPSNKVRVVVNGGK